MYSNFDEHMKDQQRNLPIARKGHSAVFTRGRFDSAKLMQK